MASMWGRTQAIKAAFVVGFLLLLLNLLGPRWDTKFDKPLQAFNARLSSTMQWPKRTHSHSEMAIQSNISTTVVAVPEASQDTKLNKGHSDNSDEKKPDVSFITDNNINNEVNISSSNKTTGNKLYANSTIIVLTNNNHNNNHDSIDYNKHSLSSITTTVAPLNTLYTQAKIRTPSTPTKPKSRKEFIAALMQQLGINPCPMVPDDLGEYNSFIINIDLFYHRCCLKMVQLRSIPHTRHSSRWKSV